MRKRFILSGYFGFKNFGDEAILSVIIEKLKQLNQRITVISSDPDYTKSKYKYVSSVYTFNLSDVTGAIAKSDYLISGGGSLLQDTTSFKSLIYYLLVIFLGLILGKKVIIFAQGIGPIKNKFGQILTKMLLKHCHYVSVRDLKSFELMKKWGINAELLCDPIFTSSVPKDIEKNEIVAIQLRDFRTMNEDFIDRLAQKVVHEFPNFRINIFSFQDSIDIEICQKFEKAINLLNPNIKTQIFSQLTDAEVIENIARSKYLLAMRFHAIIVGLITEVKTLAINYDIKIEKIATEFELPLLELNKEFENQFEILKLQDLDRIRAQVSLKNFNWQGFENAIGLR